MTDDKTPQPVNAAQAEQKRPSLSNARPISDFATGRVPEFLDLPAAPQPASNAGGEPVAFVPLTEDGRPQWAETFAADDGCYIDYPGKWRPLFARVTGIAYALRDDVGILLSALRQFEEAVGEAFDDEGGDIAAIERDYKASSLPSTHLSPPAATIGDMPSEPRPPASAAMGLSAGGEHDPGCQTGDFGPCDCSLSSTNGNTP